MGMAHTNGIEVAFSEQGEPDGLPLLLIGGLGMQLVGWPDDLVAAMVARGYRVIRFDNRDVGQSTHLTGAGRPDVAAILSGDPSSAPYTLADLAADAAGLLDALGLPAAHVVGVSMGGMIAQTLALTAPERVRSLTSVSSSTGDRETSQPTPAAGAMLLSPAATSRDEYIEQAVAGYTLVGSINFAVDTAWVRAQAGASWDRGHDPAGVARQLAAIVASPDRTAALSALTVPALVVHGGADPLIPVAAGRLAASVIPTAEMLEIDGMGHDLPRAVWGRILDKLDDVVRRGEMAREAGTPVS